MTRSKEQLWSERQGNNTRRPDEIRSEYERDLSRLIHSSAFRRLQSKTQVLGLGESDFYRTRLTHSMLWSTKTGHRVRVFPVSVF